MIGSCAALRSRSASREMRRPGMIGGTEPAKRQQVLSHLAERREATEAEAAHLRAELEVLTRREAELRAEVATLDAILAAIPEPPKESEAPSLFASPPKAPPPLLGAATLPTRRRRRKGTRREQLLPQMRVKFGSRPFTTEDVTDAILTEEP